MANTLVETNKIQWVSVLVTDYWNLVTLKFSGDFKLADFSGKILTYSSF